MEFKWIIVVLLQTTFTIVMTHKDSLSRNESMKADGETDFQRSHPITSIQSEDGDVIDCIDIYKQPAFDHPALKDHKIQMNPSSALKTETTTEKEVVQAVPTQTWRRSGSCPKGTIPIRRQHSSHNKKQFGDSKISNMLQKNRSLSILFSEGNAYYGGQGDIKVWNPYVERDDEYSTSRVAIKVGPQDDYEAVEFGWAVNPKVYGDRQTRLYVYWTVDSNNQTGCFDLTCPGFIQTSHEVALGAAINPISNPKGLPFQITAHIHKDQFTNNWWVQYNEEINIGYWPFDLFEMLRYHGTTVQWGGEVYSSRVGTTPHTPTAMGSGKFPDFIMKTSGSVVRIRVVETHDAMMIPQWVSTYTDEYYCYQTYYISDYVWEPEFYYGGPGSFNNPMCP